MGKLPRVDSDWGRLLTKLTGEKFLTSTHYVKRGRRTFVQTRTTIAIDMGAWSGAFDGPVIEYPRADAIRAIKEGRIKEFFETEIAIARIKG